MMEKGDSIGMLLMLPSLYYVGLAHTEAETVKLKKEDLVVDLLLQYLSYNPSRPCGSSRGQEIFPRGLDCVLIRRHAL